MGKIVMLSFLLWTSIAWASPITFEFEGLTLFHDGEFFQTPFYGTFTFSSSQEDLFPDDPLYDRYEFTGNPYGITVDIVGKHFEFDSLQINVYPQWSKSSFVDKTHFHVTSGSTSSEWINLNIFHDNLVNGPVETGENSLPLSPINITTYPIHKFFFNNPEAGGFVAENFTSVRPIPEPATLLLLLIGLVGIIFSRHRDR